MSNHHINRQPMKERIKFFRINRALSYDKADLLLERYYEGLTSAEEEEQLHRFLAQEHLPERYAPDQALFGYFRTKKHKPQHQLHMYLRWTAVAAVVAFGLFSVQLFVEQDYQNYAYVDGVRTTNIRDVRQQAMAAFDQMSEGPNYLQESLNELQSVDIIRQQLDVFAGIE